MSYAAYRRGLGPIVRALYRLEVRGAERVCGSGPLIVVANHLSAIDPFILGAAIPRDLHFLTKEELFRNRLLGRILRDAGCIPVDRGRGDLGAIGRAQSLLESGHVVSLFPEGHVRRQGPWLRGAARLALLTGAPLLPVRIVGTERAVAGRKIGFPRLAVLIAESIVVEPGRVTVAATRDLTERVRHAVGAL